MYSKYFVIIAQFSNRNIKELIKKPEWIEFAKNQPNLMTETLIEIICRPDFYVSYY